MTRHNATAEAMKISAAGRVSVFQYRLKPALNSVAGRGLVQLNPAIADGAPLAPLRSGC